MAFLNLFKTKKKKSTERVEQKQGKKAEIQRDNVNLQKTAQPQKKGEKTKNKATKQEVNAKSHKKGSGKAFLVLKGPQITEKATFLQNSNKYVFKVFNKATKPEVRKAVQSLYGVDVIGVQIIKSPRKAKRLGRTTGFKKAYQKAVVSLKKGQVIEIMPR